MTLMETAGCDIFFVKNNKNWKQGQKCSRFRAICNITIENKKKKRIKTQMKFYKITSILTNLKGSKTWKEIESNLDSDFWYHFSVVYYELYARGRYYK